jgi:hypothetical protein
MVNASFSGVDFPFITNVPNEAIQQRTISIPAEHNFLDIVLQDNTWVSIWVDNQELMSDRSSNPDISFRLSPGTYTIRTDGTIQHLTSRSVQTEQSPFEQLFQTRPSKLRLTSDAPDQHIVDGVGEIPADGTSFCTIMIEKMSLNGTPLTDQELQDELFLRTTGGTLMDNMGTERIRSIQLQTGKAAFRLVSESTPKVVTVSVFGREPLLSKSEIQIEFI